jgi:hypothetical protein
MMIFKRLFSTCVVLSLAACGGGGGSPGTPLYGSGTPPPTSGVSVSTLSIVLTDALGAPVSSLANNVNSTIKATVTALDASNAVVPGAAVTVSVDLAQISPSGTVTDDKGQITAQISMGSDRANRTVTVSARSTNAQTTATFLVTGARLTGTTPPTAAPSTEIQLTYTLEDASANAIANQAIALTGNGAAVAQGVTDASGKWVARVTTPAATGPFTLVATAANTTLERIVQVQTSAVPVADIAVLSSSVSANPSVVGINSTTTSNSTTIRALFKGASNAPVPRVRVRFTLPDPNSVGGRFSDIETVYSDATGTATTTYIPGPVSSPTDGVIVRACWATADFNAPTAPGVCPAAAADGSPVRSTDATLTVVDEALRLSIGTDELIGAPNLTYTKEYVVVVVDASGRAKADVEVTPKIDLTRFYKGFYGLAVDTWVRTAPTGILQTPGCNNEDSNRNGSREVGEDVNGNLELDPAGVTITMVGTSKTDASGKAIVRIEYPRDRATWIDYIITVTGKVGGSEGLAVYNGTLPALASAIKNKDVPPSFQFSPYGVGPNCTDTN